MPAWPGMTPRQASEVRGWWPLNPSQQEALFSPAELLLFGGQSGGGKTDFLVGDAMQEFRIPSFRGLLLRESLGEFDQIGDRMERAYLPLKARYRHRTGGGQWIFPSGARIRFGYLASDRDLSKYRGNPYSWLGIDESGLHPLCRVQRSSRSGGSRTGGFAGLGILPPIFLLEVLIHDRPIAVVRIALELAEIRAGQTDLDDLGLLAGGDGVPDELSLDRIGLLFHRSPSVAGLCPLA